MTSDDTASASPPAPRKTEVIRTTDAEAIALARRLIAEAKHATLATLEPGTGHPSASLISLSSDVDGCPLTLVSRLSAHTVNLLADPRASLLVGEPGKGDPLAHPRMTVRVGARVLDRASPEGTRARARILAHQPKTQLYIDFPDFLLLRLEPEAASLNGGFGKAYELSRADLIA
jgi:heme iron utilization protein